MRGCGWVVVEWVAVENLRSAELHCQYRARFLSSVSLFLSCSLSHRPFLSIWSFVALSVSVLSHSLYFSLSLSAG